MPAGGRTGPAGSSLYKLRPARVVVRTPLQASWQRRRAWGLSTARRDSRGESLHSAQDDTVQAGDEKGGAGYAQAWRAEAAVSTWFVAPSLNFGENVVNREELHDAGYVVAIKREINLIFAANMVQLFYSDMI